MRFYRIMVDSFLLLRMCPRLFIPKILIAFLWLPTFILIPYFMIQSGFLQFILQPNAFPLGQIDRQQSLELVNMLFPLSLVLLYGLLVELIDFFIINPMYPMMIRDFYRKKEVFLQTAFFNIVHNFNKIFPPLLRVWIINFTVLFAVAIFVDVALLSQNTLLFSISVVTSIIATFVLFVLFYFVYPISTLEEFRSPLKKITATSLKHKLNVTKAFIIRAGITFLSYICGWLIISLSSPEQFGPKLTVFSILVLARLLVALFSTYEYVLNSVFYFGFEKKQFFKVG